VRTAGLKGEPDHLFHNNGDGTFTDVSMKAGVNDPNNYYGLAAVFADVNNDGKPDLMVANDSCPNYLYINKGNGTFEDASYASGYALNENGRETASMGIAVGDYRNNGMLDLYNTVSRTTTTRSIATKATPTSARSAINQDSRKPRFPSSPGAAAFSTTTTTAGKICSSPTVTSIPRSTTADGAPPSRNVHCCFIT